MELASTVNIQVTSFSADGGAPLTLTIGDVATLLTGVGTVLLSIATIALVYWARKYTQAHQSAVAEMKTGRIEAVEPALQLEATTLGPAYPMARLTSCGRGYALNIRGGFGALPVGPRRGHTNCAIRFSRLASTAISFQRSTEQPLRASSLTSAGSGWI